MSRRLLNRPSKSWIDTVILSPKLIIMILADNTLPSQVRQEFGTSLHAKLEEGVWGGEEFEVGET